MGQIQSPGYQGGWAPPRRQAVDTVAIVPRESGSRRPHSRQYSWYGSYGDPQLGHRSGPGSTGGPGGGVASGWSGGGETPTG